MENGNFMNDKKQFLNRVVFSGSPYVRFMVSDPSIDGTDDFTRWLEENGYYLSAGAKFHPGCHFIYIDTETGALTPGAPGFDFVTILGGHDLTIDDFKQIHAIFSRYRGLKLGEFPTE